MDRAAKTLKAFFNGSSYIYKEMLDFCHQYQVRVQSEGSALEEAWLERFGTLGLG